ncbi:hypothetical protein [Marispirochaeta sp.]|uniref:hypothetical protein n=1 Tax=Marispirochaeta sp. TaxID=2038653 RepID=UPI0029C92CFC|nr:hypothetical protein [Marispirochaeta sp.]
MQWIQMLLENFPEYTRSLLKPKVLANRIKRIYAIDWDEYEPTKSYRIILPDNVEKIIASHPFVKQRQGRQKVPLWLLQLEAVL